MKFRRIGVLTSGGDAPGMNAAVKAVTCAALDRGVEVLGVIGGYAGLMYDELRPLSKNDVAGIASLGGTALYSNRCPEFATDEGLKKAVETCRKYEIDGIVAIGGDGTFRGATDLSAYGIHTIGIPGTIDNDITATDASIGFDTAMNTVVEIGDKLRDTCDSHARCAVIEVMGRGAGYIALECGIALNAIDVALAEIPFDKEALFAKMKKRRDEGQRSFVVVVAESMGGEFGETLTKEIDALGISARFIRPAHIVRGGIPTLADRLLASRMGEKAVDMLLDGKSDLVVCQKNGKIVTEEIRFSLIVDRMYKGKLKDGDLDAFTPEEVARMKALCDEKHKDFADMYEVMHNVGC